MKRTLLLTLFCSIALTATFAQNKPKQTEPDFTNFVNPFQQKPTAPTLVLRPETTPDFSVSKNGHSRFVKFKNEPAATDATTVLQQIFELRPTDSWQFKSEFLDELGWTHRRFEQYFQGLPVIGGEVTTHEKDGKIVTVNGHFYDKIQATATPTISGQAAIVKAMQHIGAEQWQWQTGNEDFYKANFGGSLQPTAVLAFAASGGNLVSDAFRLAYKVRINAQKPYGVYDVFVDAQNGSVIWKVDKIANTDAIGSAQTLYSGTQQITTDNTGNGFRLREAGRGIETKNMNSGTDFNAAVDFTNTTNNWVASGVALSNINITQINNDWYTNFSENPANGGLPDLFLVVRNSANTVLYQSTTIWNQQPPVSFSGINLNVPAGQTYTVEIWDNDNSVLSHDFLGSLLIIGTTPTTNNFSGSGNTGNYTLGAATADPALDAHWGMEKTYDFFFTKFNRDSYDGNGALIRNFVHFDNAMENAFWDPNLQALVFGDGASTFSPLTSIDVAGHEFSHAVITNTADLVYQGESGALNESFADIFGTAIEFFGKPSTANWTIGEEITLTAPNYLRSMSDPNSGLDQQPDTYNGTHWASTTASFDNGGVHVNSGVQNYWYYLLAVGGSGTNDIGNAFSVTGIGVDAATAIAYRNLAVYLNPNSNFADAVNGSVQAAQDLYGVGSPQAAAVQQAWYAVGLASSPGSFCSTGNTLTALSGTLSDGSGSANYQDNSNCSWLIQPTGANQIVLTFSSFDTEAGYDTVKVYDGINANAPLLLEWTGSTLPPAITSTTGALFVRFSSDNSQTAAGWEASYAASGAAFCNGGTTLTAQTATFSDGSGASDYANNAFCYWKIAPAGATSITLNFNNFNTEANYDGVIIYDGESVNDPVLLNWSGSNLPSAVTSTGGLMLVVFTSDATVTASGWEATYTISGGNNYCGNTVVTEDFTVISDGSGANNYLNNSLCTWLIQPTNAQAIDLYFTAFDVEAAPIGGLLVYDAVEIYDGSDDTAPLLGQYTGSTVPSVISSTGGTMFIKFYSDASITAGGWEAYFVTQTASYCQGTTTFSSAAGTFTDGSGNNEYGNAAECSWKIPPTTGAAIALNFSEFDTEPNFDFVLVYDGQDDTAPLLGSFSGNQTPSEVVGANGLYVVFVSDESITAGGFTATYSPSINTAAQRTEYEWQVFPNPFNEVINLRFTLAQAENVTVELFDLLGRRLQTEQLGSIAAGQQDYRLSTRDLPQGTYILKTTISGTVLTERIMKQ